MPPYSTELESIIVTVMLVINLMALINLKCNNQSKNLILAIHFHHLDTMMCFSTLYENSGISIPRCHSMHTCSPHLLKVSAHFPQIQTILPAKSFYFYILIESLCWIVLYLHKFHKNSNNAYTYFWINDLVWY